MKTSSNPAPFYRPGPEPRTVLSPDGEVRRVPDDWALLPPGDAGLTRRVKAAGPSWTVKEKGRRNRMFSKGVWAPAAAIDAARAALDAERTTPAYARKQAAARQYRDKKQLEYGVEFELNVLAFLDFAPTHSQLARSLARLVTEHAIPVGSGTVARTERIPVEDRAEAAVIAWMRHQTTAYDHLRIQRVKGRRREVRRELARRSHRLLDAYRRGEAPASDCPLQAALTDAPPLPPPPPVAPPVRPKGTRGGWTSEQS